MIKEIQKSIQLINFSDSIFDQPKTETETISVDSMLKAKDQVDGKFVKFENVLKKYFSNEIDREEEEILKEILVCHWPFMKANGAIFMDTIKKERDRVECIEWKCFGTVFGEAERKEQAILSYYKRTLLRTEIEEISVLSKGKIDLVDFKCGKFDSKRLAKLISLMEAYEYVCINPTDLYTSKNNGSEIVALFNRFTNFLISSILICGSGEERKVVVKRILKLAKEFREIGAMNSLKSCLAALESNSIHRLQVIEGQDNKYKKRYVSLAVLTSPEGNYSNLRENACLVPWFGLILKDFSFIKELAGESAAFINIPLSFCTRRLLNSMTSARDTSKAFYNNEMVEMRKKAAVMRFWLRNEAEILYETEEAQYSRSLIFSIIKK